MAENDVTLAEAAAVIRAGERFVVVSHARPDGDAIGSVLGLGLALRHAGKDVTIVNEDGVPAMLQFLLGSETILIPDEFEGLSLDADTTVIALDTSNKERLGARFLDWAAAAGTWVNIDHHISNEGYGDHVYVDGAAPATGEIVHQLLGVLDLPVTSAIANALYAAISSDTGSFRFPSTTATTYRVAADLIDAGANVGTLGQALYESFPLRRLKLAQYLFGTLSLDGGGAIASWALPRSKSEELGLAAADAEGLIDLIRSVRDVEVAVFFEEMPDGKVRASVRSRGAVDVSALCAQFGGGGHRLAAGVRLAGPLDRARSTFIEKANQALIDATRTS